MCSFVLSKMEAYIYDKQIKSQAKAHRTVSYVIITDDLRVSNSSEPEFLFPKFHFSF